MDHCKTDPANKIACEMVSTKSVLAKQFKHAPKRFVVKDCIKVAAEEDPIILDIIRSKEVVTSVLVGDVINLEKELSEGEKNHKKGGLNCVFGKLLLLRSR